MKLSKIYSNQPSLFKSIVFNDGINFIISDDHSVGKTKLFDIVDYCLMKSKPSFFKLDVFSKLDLVFYLELKLNNDKYLTIRRSIKGRSNNAIKELERKEDLTDLDDSQFDKVGSEEVIQDVLNQKIYIELNGQVVKYRHYLNFFLRDQDNQSDVFRLNKFLRNKDIDYKPIISSLLGINGSLVYEKYTLEAFIEKTSNEIKFYESEIGRDGTRESVVGKIELLKDKKADKEEKYQNFDFYLSEHHISNTLIKDVENEVSKLNQNRNSLLREIDYINQALGQELSLNINDIEELFHEIEIAFPDDIKKNYEQVLNFNKQMAVDRKKILQENKLEFEQELVSINNRLFDLNSQRSEALSVLKDTDTMSKFKRLEREIIEIEAGVKYQEDKLSLFDKIEQSKLEIEDAHSKLKTIKVETSNSLKNNMIGTIKKNIDYYSRRIFGEDALFSVGLNTHDNIEFSLDIANNGNFDNEKAEGHTIKKLLCFVFGAALLKSYKDTSFFKFIAFDSPFDGDKDDYQLGLYEAFKDLASLDMQIIVTTILDEVKDFTMRNEITKSYTVLFLSSKSRLLGEF